MDSDHRSDTRSAGTSPSPALTRTEPLVVFGLTVGVPVLLTLTGTRAPGLDFGQRRLLITLGAEVAVVAILWPWLARRGWAFHRIAGPPAPRDVLRGFGIAALAYVAYYFSAITWAALAPDMIENLAGLTPQGLASPWVIIAVCMINPIVEEFLWLAYGITALGPLGARTAILISVSLRTVVHTYQGVIALVAILPLGLVFTIYYARTRRFWPVVVAHVLFDAVGLLGVVQR